MSVEGGDLQVTNHHPALPRAFPANTAALLADANEFSLTAPRERVTIPALRSQEMELRHRWRKLLSQGHAIHLQQSMQNLALPWLVYPCPPSGAHLHPVTGSGWLCPRRPRAGFKFKVQDSQCRQPGSLSWRAELSPELP